MGGTETVNYGSKRLEQIWPGATSKAAVELVRTVTSEPLCHQTDHDSLYDAPAQLPALSELSTHVSLTLESTTALSLPQHL